MGFRGWGRTLAAPLAAVITWSASVEAQEVATEPAQDEQTECVVALEQAQDLRSAGRLVAAREQLLVCSRPMCLEVVKIKCTGWLAEVDGEIPTVLVKVIDADARPTFGVSLTLDGKDASDALRGIAQSADPGAHLLRATTSAGDSAETYIAVLQGQKNQVFELRFPPAPPPPPPPTPYVAPAPLPPANPYPPPPVESEDGTMGPAAWVSFGLGAAALIGASITGAVAMATGSRCEDFGCSQEEIDDGGRVADASTGLFVVAGVGVAAGITMVLLQGDF